MTFSQLDRYYTPDHIAGALADWAIRSPNDHLLDPSFGGCAFFRMGAAALARRGARHPFRQLHGVDIDPEAKQYLLPLLKKGAREENFIFSDFLAIDPQHLKRSSFDVVFGNPPYVRHHCLGDRRLVDRVDNSVTIPRTAGLWAYFVLHGLSFVARGGTMAMIIPAAILEAEYAASLLSELERSFASVHLILIPERVFDSAEATTMLLLARGRSEGISRARVGVCATSAGLPSFLTSLDRRTRTIGERMRYRSELLQLAGHDRAVQLWGDLRAQGITLGDVANISLGTVTGSNSTFLITDEQRRQLLRERRWTVPVLPNGKVADGLDFTRTDLQELVRRGRAAFLLVIPTEADVQGELDTYLRAAEDAGVNRRTKCAARKPWYSILRIRRPDAFLPYMSHNRLRLLRNLANATSTNALHHVIWRSEVSAGEQRSYALQSLGSIFQLAAELSGKVYGGGVLKLEIRPARTLPLFGATRHSFAEMDTLATRVDELLRGANISAARSLVDAWIVDNFCSAKIVVECRKALKFLRSVRKDPIVQPRRARARR
jgi:adenine-specific DNA-methyltransferase